MSFDDYANHIYQKHRLAIALAIIRTKPPNLTTTQYLDEIKSKINDKMADDDVTVCSDDFIIDDDDEMNDSINILKDVDCNMLAIDENRGAEIGGDVNRGAEIVGDVNRRAEIVGDEMNDDILRQPTIPEDLTQMTYYNSQSQITDTQMLLNDDLPNHDNRDFSTNFSRTEPFISTNNNKEVINSKLKRPYKKTASLNPTNKDFNPVKDYSKDMANNNNDSNMTFYDSQQTIPYSVPEYTQMTHYSASQVNIEVPSKYLYGSKSKTNEIDAGNENLNAVRNIQDKKNIIAREKENFNVVENTQDGNILENAKDRVKTGNIHQSYDAVKNNNQIAKETEYIQTMSLFSQINDNNFDEILSGYESIETEGHNTRNDVTVTTNNIEKEMSKNGTESIVSTQNFIEDHNYFDTQTNPTEFSQNLQIIDIEIAKEYTQTFNVFSQNVDKTIKINEDIEKRNTVEENNTQMDLEDSNFNTNNNLNDQNSEIANTNVNSDLNNENIVEFEIADVENDIEEVISYKVLEEFNKVKTFLHRRERRMSCDGYSTDSGYRSDSQRSNNRNALQLSGNWLDQSGCCLFNYIMQCHIVAATRDITQEIAQVLCDLIDRLHEEEKYPVFLEEILDTVDVLLKQVFEGDTNDNSEILKQDEKIQRLLLLNKSIHIQKHTIEKITHILETLHAKITEKDSTYELENITQIENASYIFHLLEILLKKYLKSKEISSQYTQASEDEEKVLKRSSITDIWRKKWNLSQKTFEGSKEKKCVLKSCSDVLNKIVVECVTNYSLVAFSALKCFNTMQS